MKAVVYDQYGGPEVLRLEDIAVPVPKDNEVLLKVYTVSINDWDWGLLTGTPWVNRFMFGFRSPKKMAILCSDVAGVVASVGPKVTKFKAGDKVFGDISSYWGGLAEYVCAPEQAFIMKPSTMSFIDAASIPQAGILAKQGLIDTGKIRNNQKVLINGGGGGAGTFGAQIAKHFNAETTGVDHTIKLDVMRQSGFDHVIDYTKEDFTKGKIKYDLIFDVKTTRPIFSYTHVLNPGGVYVTCGGYLNRLFEALILSPLVRILTGKHVRIVAMKAATGMDYFAETFEVGKMKPVIDSVYRFEDFRAAFERYGRSEHTGKIIIEIDGQLTKI